MGWYSPIIIRLNLVLLAVHSKSCRVSLWVKSVRQKTVPYPETEITSHFKLHFEMQIFTTIYLFIYVFTRVFGKPILCLHVSSQQLTTPEAAAAAITNCTQQEGCNDSISFRTISVTLWRCCRCMRSETVTYFCAV